MILVLTTPLESFQYSITSPSLILLGHSGNHGGVCYNIFNQVSERDTVFTPSYHVLVYQLFSGQIIVRVNDKLFSNSIPLLGGIYSRFSVALTNTGCVWPKDLHVVP